MALLRDYLARRRNGAETGGSRSTRRQSFTFWVSCKFKFIITFLMRNVSYIDIGTSARQINLITNTSSCVCYIWLCFNLKDIGQVPKSETLPISLERTGCFASIFHGGILTGWDHDCVMLTQFG